jgi:hypothetical protein
MKKLILPFALLLIFILSSCSSDSKSTNTDPVQGQWKLVAVDGFFTGTHDTFTPGLITWTFNPITQTVSVVNNNTNPNSNDLLETGVYNYHFVNNPDAPCAESIDINGTVYGCYTVANDSLIIDQAIADGFSVTLKH